MGADFGAFFENDNAEIADRPLLPAGAAGSPPKDRLGRRRRSRRRTPLQFAIRQLAVHFRHACHCSQLDPVASEREACSTRPDTPSFLRFFHATGICAGFSHY